MWEGFGNHGGWLDSGLLHMFLYWGVIILVIILLIKWLSDGYSETDRYVDRSPLDILKERYARGELTREEFEAKKHDLGE